MKTSSNVYTLQLEMAQVWNDLYQKVESALDTYAQENLPKMPEFKKISTNRELYYDTYVEIMSAMDRVVCLIARVDLVYQQLMDVKSSPATRDMMNDMREMSNFKKSLDENLEKMRGYRFGLIEIRKILSDRIKLLQTLAFDSQFSD